MKQFTDGSNNFPLVEKSTSSAGSSPTAANFNGPTAELVAIVRSANFPLDPLSGALIGSDGKPLMESESNKQILRAIQFLDQQKYFQMLDKLNKIVKTNVGNGRVEGLETTKTASLKISLSAGFGITPNGQQITTTEALEFDLTAEASEIEKTIEVGLLYNVGQDNYIIGDGNPKYKAEEIFTLAINSTDPNFLALAKVTINNTGITKITVPISLTEQRKIDAIDIAYPINFQYTQYPNDITGLFDETETPKALFGGDWEKQFTTKGVFFRTEGGLSTESRSTSTGIQLDAMQLLTGEIGSIDDEQACASGVFRISWWGSGPSGSGSGFRVNFNNSRQVRTSTENRPVNMLMIIWKRIG